jgi:hypothetical protein
MLKLAAKPSCLGGGEFGKKNSNIPNRLVKVRILLLQRK